MFSLGVLQELARFSWKDPQETPNQTPEEEPALLADFDYLSTVSGGGYTGGWFTSWAARTSTADVIKQLVRRPIDKLKPEPLPVTRIREYASFLNPRLGFTSADTWTLGTTILRNIVLNWLVLLPLLAAVLTIPAHNRCTCADSERIALDRLHRPDCGFSQRRLRLLLYGERSAERG